MNIKKISWTLLALTLILLVGASHVSAQKKWLGTWTSDGTSVELTIKMVDGKAVVDAVDASDGELLEVSAVTFAKKTMAYTLHTPSTNYTVKAEGKLKGKNEFVEELIGVEADPIVYRRKE